MKKIFILLCLLTSTITFTGMILNGPMLTNNSNELINVIMYAEAMMVDGHYEGIKRIVPQGLIIQPGQSINFKDGTKFIRVFHTFADPISSFVDIRHSYTIHPFKELWLIKMNL